MSKRKIIKFALENLVNSEYYDIDYLNDKIDIDYFNDKVDIDYFNDKVIIVPSIFLKPNITGVTGYVHEIRDYVKENGKNINHKLTINDKFKDKEGLAIVRISNNPIILAKRIIHELTHLIHEDYKKEECDEKCRIRAELKATFSEYFLTYKILSNNSKLNEKEIVKSLIKDFSYYNVNLNKIKKEEYGYYIGEYLFYKYLKGKISEKSAYKIFKI